MRAFFQLGSWLSSGSVSRSRPFEVTCVCGQIHKGQRQARRQIIRCAQCRRELFVFPQSPLPAVGPAPGDSQSSLPVSLVPKHKGLLRPVAIGLAILGATGLAVVFSYDRFLSGRPALGTAAASPAGVEQLLQAGRKSLEDEDYKKAHLELQQVPTLLADEPPMLPSVDRRRLLQLYRQAAVLADWIGEPLEQVLSRMVRLNEAEWQRVDAGYRGKTVVLDLEVHRDATGQCHGRSNWPGGAPRFRLNLQDLAVLKYLPLEEPRQILVAARLAEVRRAGPETCLVRLQHDSGVLLTDTRTASFGFPMRPQLLQEILKQQQRWLEQVP